MGRVMVKMSNAVLELPKRTAILDFDRPDASQARTKVRGLFWLTLATVVLGLIVVLASLWKIVSAPSVPAADAAVPVMVTSAASTPAPPVVTCDGPSPESPTPPPPAELPAEPTTRTTPATPSGSPDLEQYR